MCHHQQHTGASLGRSGINFSHRAFSDGGLQYEAVAGLTAFLHFMRIGGLAHHFKSTVDAVNRFAHQALAIFIQRVARSGLVHVHYRGRFQASVRTARSVRRSSGILKSLWP